MNPTWTRWQRSNLGVVLAIQTAGKPLVAFVLWRFLRLLNILTVVRHVLERLGGGGGWFQRRGRRKATGHTAHFFFIKAPVPHDY